MISVFGSTGFIGSRFCELHPSKRVDRDCNVAKQKDILYLISTTHNYNTLDVDVHTNLYKLSQVLQNLGSDQVFNFVSSWFVYGSSGLIPAKEEVAQYRPSGNYSYTKWLAEKMVVWYCERENISWRIFRLANVFGPGDKFSEKKNALQYLVNELKHDRPIKLYYGGDFVRDYIYVDDVCNMMAMGLEVLPENGVYNIGSGIPTRFGDWIMIAKDILGSKSEIVSVDPPEFHNKVSTKDFYLDTSKTKQYGIEPLMSPVVRFVRMVANEA